MTVVVAGGGIAGLTLALTCHEIGVDVRVFESVASLKPLGVGINLQPNAVRELYQLGLAEDLKSFGIEAEEWALYFYGAHPIWTEPRGTLAGYRWPQFSVHRGQFHMRLLEHVRQRLGDAAVVCDARLVGYENVREGVVADFADARGRLFSQHGDLLIGADGIHSALREQMHPTQGGVNWNGAVMWRGVSRAKPPKSKNAFVMVGGLTQRFICYPVEPLDARGETLLNWIAELRFDDTDLAARNDWNRTAEPEAFMDAFADWDFGWLSVPDIVGRSTDIWEYPMVDRDPVDRWVDGRACLIGDAAHAMFPHGSGGASQAIVDARVLGAALVDHGETPNALEHFERQVLPAANALVLRNREEGPIGVLNDIEARVDRGMPIGAAIDQGAVAEFMAQYKIAAGTARDVLNRAPPLIEPRR